MIDLAYRMLPCAKAAGDLHAFRVLSHLTLPTTTIEVKLIFAFYISGNWGTERLSNVPKVTYFESQIQTQEVWLLALLFSLRPNIWRQPSSVRIVCPRGKTSYSLIVFVTIHRVTSHIRMGPWKPLSLDRSGTVCPLLSTRLSLGSREAKSFAKPSTKSRVSLGR